MLTKSSPDKPYPEQKECLENTRHCEFDVDHICHECGKPMCSQCAVGIDHQPGLVKFTRRNQQGQVDRTMWHCQDTECLEAHFVQTQKMAGGLGAIALGVLILWFVGGSPLFLTLLALAAILGGGFVTYKEWALKTPKNEELTFLDMWPDITG